MPNDKEFELDDLESFSFDDLSLDEAPPAADDGSTDDPFGVWVKSAPEDIGGDAADPLADLGDSPQDPLPEDDFLSSEELAKLDDSFDFVTVSEEPLEGETPLEDEIAFLDTPEAVAAEKAAESTAAFDEVSLDDFVSFDEAGIEESTEFSTEEFSSPEVPTVEDDLTEEFLDIDIDIEDDIGDEELEIIEGAAPRPADEAEDISLDTFSAQDVDLSEFGDFEEVGVDSDPALAGADDLPEVLDLPDEIELPEDGVFEETLLDDPLPHLTDEGPVAIDLEPDDQTDLDHILALEEDLTSGIRPTEPETPTPAAPAADLAALILGKIEQELSSIKQEITELKKEVTHLRAAPAPVAPPSFDEAVTTEETPEDTKPHGFFDEEDDETIALTGDELDNILSTAEISEGEEQGLSLEEDLLGMDAEGNLLEPQTTSDVVHVTDEEFLAGTALDLNEPDPLDQEPSFGIPESIELEEGLPLSLDEDQTEDLLTTSHDDFDVAPLPEGLLEGTPEPLEIPFDDEIALELEDTAPLAPDLDEVSSPASPAVAEDEMATLPGLDEMPSLDADPDGWSPTGLPTVEEIHEEIELSLEEDPEPVAEIVPPPAPRVDAASAPSTLSPGLKDELKAVLQYMDKLLASLPDEKIQEFAESEHFEVYKRLFEELGLIE